MFTLNHYLITKSIHLLTKQHFLTEPPTLLETLSISRVRIRCKCNDFQSAKYQERSLSFWSFLPPSVVFSCGLVVFILFIGMISIKPDRVPSPDPLLEEIIQSLQAKGWIADTLNNLTRTRSNSRYDLLDSVLLMPNHSQHDQPTPPQTPLNWPTVNWKWCRIHLPIWPSWTSHWPFKNVEHHRWFWSKWAWLDL